MERALKARLVALVSLVILSLFAWLGSSGGVESSPYLQVKFIDVGQGDAIFIETPDGAQALIDGGPNNVVLTTLAQSMSWFDRDLDMVLGTHQDLDHVAGLVGVLEKYEVDNIILTEGKGASAASKSFIEAVSNETENKIYARKGQVYSLGSSTTIEILSPADNPEQWDSNTGSIVLLLHYGNTSFLLTGDAPQGIEDYLVGAYGAHLKADVLKLGHHGSKNSSSGTFLRTVLPTYVVVSAGKDNRYGHPHEEVLTRVEENTRAEVVSTAELGDITFLSDGEKVWIK